MIRAARLGVLPKVPSPTIGGRVLPAGVRVIADASYAAKAPVKKPVLWVTEKELTAIELRAAMHALIAAYPESGLWPLALDSLSKSDDARPWLDGEIDPSASSPPTSHVAQDVLAKWWGNGVPVAEEDEESLGALAPFGREFPGLAPAIGPDDAPLPDLAEIDLQGRLGLVAAMRPADAVAVLGWMGPVNAFGDMGLLAAVLASWEERFGAYVVGIGFATLTLAVARPPMTLEAALPIAAEHFAACSDAVHQGAGSIEALAESLIDAPAWTFWWD